VDADVHPGDGDECRERDEADDPAADEIGENERAGEARGGMAGGERAPEVTPQEGVGLRKIAEGSRSVDEALDQERGQVGAPDAHGRQGAGEDERAPRDDREDGSERDPEKTREAGRRESHEEPVERRDAVLDDPEEQVSIGVGER
jgi:hypothetical protein